MHRGYKMVKDAVRQCPLPLLSLKENKLSELANSFIKYSVGIEVEVNTKDLDALKEDILLKNMILCYLDPQEVRFRTFTGIVGLIDVYNICELLKKHCLFNSQSGIHYHIDFTDRPEIVKNFDHWMYTFKRLELLKQLDSWNYKGSYNKRAVTWNKTSWVSTRSNFNTFEFRIGEMTFDYQLMIKRIIHLQNICHKIKKDWK